MEIFTVRKLKEKYTGGERNFSGIEIEENPNEFIGVCLEGCDFSQSFICGNFSGASLRGSNFSNANLKTSLFEKADLEGCNFSNSALCATTFKGANLKGAVFSGAYFHSCKLGEGEIPNW